MPEETKEDREDFFGRAAHVITRFFKTTGSPPSSPEPLVLEVEEPDDPIELGRDHTRRRFSKYDMGSDLETRAVAR